MVGTCFFRCAFVLFAVAQIAYSDDNITYVEWDSGVGGIALRALGGLTSPARTNKLIDLAGLGNIDKELDRDLFHALKVMNHSVDASLASVQFSGLDTINTLVPLGVNGHYNLTTGGGLDGLKFGLKFNSVVRQGDEIVKSVPFVMTGGLTGLNFKVDVEVLADASKLNAFAILRDHSLIWKSFVGAHVNTAGVTIDVLDKVYVEYLDDTKLGKEVTDAVVAEANKIMLPLLHQVTGGLLKVVVNALIDHVFHH